MGLRYWTVLNKVEKIKHKYHIHFFRQPAHRELGRTLCRTRLGWTCSTRKHPWLWETPTDSKGKNNTASRLVKIINIFRLRHPHPTIPVRLIWQKLKRVGILGRQTQTVSHVKLLYVLDKFHCSAGCSVKSEQGEKKGAGTR